MAKILDGRAVAKALNKQTTAQIDSLQEAGITPTLAIMRADENPASIQYEKSAARYMEKMRIATKHVVFEEGVNEAEFLEALDQLNNDSDVHGILVMQPLPRSISLARVSERISPTKDIDGMHPLNLGHIMAGNQKAHLPSTVKAVVELLRYYDISVSQKDICVIGKSNTVGKPLSILLLNERATVSNCHTGTQNLEKYTSEADILISATGSIGLVTPQHVKKGAVVIDIGFNFKDNKAHGDVQYEEVAKIASAITPVPGGVGSVTTAALAQQVANAAQWLQQK